MLHIWLTRWVCILRWRSRYHFVFVFETFAPEQDMNTSVALVHAGFRDLFDSHLQGATVGSNL